MKNMFVLIVPKDLCVQGPNVSQLVRQGGVDRFGIDQTLCYGKKWIIVNALKDLPCLTT